MNDVPVGRLAPTPSAELHVGNLFASVCAWLAARSQGGRLVLRIEDLDYGRCRPEFSEAILRDYRILGITWDNEDILYQHDRTAAYEGAFAALREEGLLYPCFCSRADLHAASAPHVGERYLYPGTCKGLSEAQRRARADKRPPAYRLSVPDMDLAFLDGIQGPFGQNLMRECGDYIVKRSDGVFSYQLAVVLDDLHQGVTQIVRGVDLMDSSPQQSHLRSILDPDAPSVSYLHVPLLVDADGRRLSKRDHDQTLSGMLGHFASTEHFIGYLAGITGLAETKEPISLDGLLRCFSFERLSGVREIRWQLPG